MFVTHLSLTIVVPFTCITDTFCGYLSLGLQNTDNDSAGRESFVQQRAAASTDTHRSVWRYQEYSVGV